MQEVKRVFILKKKKKKGKKNQNKRQTCWRYFAHVTKFVSQITEIDFVII